MGVSMHVAAGFMPRVGGGHRVIARIQEFAEKARVCICMERVRNVAGGGK